MHCSLEEFNSLSREEQLIWKLWVPEEWRRQNVFREKANEDAAEARRKRQAMRM